MQNIVKAISRPILVNDKQLTFDDLCSTVTPGSRITITLPAQERKVVAPVYKEEPEEEFCAVPEPMKVGGTYIVKVRQYMTHESTPEFDFMQKWNNNIPMPFRIMRATVVKETRGMFMVTCSAVPLASSVCMRCGRKLTHPVSRLYGIGPECGGHAHINPFETEEELYANLEKVTSTLSQITWAGWIIKSAIEEYKKV